MHTLLICKLGYRAESTLTFRVQKNVFSKKPIIYSNHDGFTWLHECLHSESWCLHVSNIDLLNEIKLLPHAWFLAKKYLYFSVDIHMILKVIHLKKWKTWKVKIVGNDLLTRAWILGDLPARAWISRHSYACCFYVCILIIFQLEIMWKL